MKRFLSIVLIIILSVFPCSCKRRMNSQSSSDFEQTKIIEYIDENGNTVKKEVPIDEDFHKEGYEIISETVKKGEKMKESEKDTNTASKAKEKTENSGNFTQSEQNSGITSQEDKSNPDEGLAKSSLNSLVRNGKVKILGRAGIIDSLLQMDWVNSGFEVIGTFDGQVRIHTESERILSILNVSIDGKAPYTVEVPKGTSSVKIAENLSGTHTISVISGTSLRFGTLSVKMILYSGSINIFPADNKLKIEVLGDSLSCGWGLDANGANFNDTELVRYSNSYYTYAALTARELNADLSVVAYCARTIGEVNEYWKNLNDRANAPKWNHSENPQDIVIINLGTNDEWRIGNAATALTDAKNILNDVRNAYPDAYIIWCYGMTSKNSDYEAAYLNAVKSLTDKGDSKVFSLKFTPDTSCYEGHPSRDAHEDNAVLLTSFIKSHCADVLK